MMSLRPYYAVTHIVSQITSRYVSVNLPRNSLSFDPCDQTGVEQWSRQEWYDFLLQERREPSGLLPWFKSYLVRSDPEGLILLDKIDSHFTWCRSADAKYLLLCDPMYPDMLRAIPQAPLGFTILGNPSILNSVKISVVGSRRTAGPVLEECYQLGYLLGRMNIATVSGGAFGCDIATHSGVLSSGLKPLPAIVVFANGLKRLYPQGNREQFKEIYQAGGILLSERLWDQLPKPYDFPIRNRIISGLSMWTLVMGARRHSGAMITARLALDQGREVSVYLPDKEKYFCEGSQILVEDGAASFTSAQDFCNRMLP